MEGEGNGEKKNSEVIKVVRRPSGSDINQLMMRKKQLMAGLTANNHGPLLTDADNT